MAMKGASKGKGGYGAMRGGNQYQRPTPYEAPAQRESAMCSVHNKKRSLECLQHDPITDTYSCSGRNTCKEALSGEMGGGETALCAVHQKNRLLSSLEMDQWGGYACIPSAQCKVSAAQGGNYMPAHRSHHRHTPVQQDGQGLCILHNKARSWSCLQEDGYGTFRCFPPHTCKVKEGEPIAAPPVYGGKGGGYGADRRRPIAAPQVFPVGQDSVLCAVHHKKRSMANLHRGPSGLFECMPGQECKVQWMGEGQQMSFNDGGAAGSYVCSVHGKNRSASVMVDDGAGGFQCSPTAQCKVKMGGDFGAATQAAPGTAPCSTHGKTRSMTFLMDDGLGGMMCTPEHECK